MTWKKTEREQLERTLHSIVTSGKQGKSSRGTGGKTTASNEDELLEPTEEDLNRRFMIIENEQGQPEMVKAFFAGDLDDEDYEEQ